MKAPKNRRELEKLAARGEDVRLEFKRSTAESRDAMRTVCAFLNGKGGLVLFGIRPEGRIEGQHVTDKSLRELAQALDRFDPPVVLEPVRIGVGKGLEAVVLAVAPARDGVPATYDGRAYERVSSTTRVMPRQNFESLLLARTHSRARWENRPAEVANRDLDRDEVLNISRAARDSGRLFGPASRGLDDLLERLGLRVNGQILRAAVVLFGRNFLPHYPQCELRMARFRGADKLEFLDQRTIRAGAFKLLEEAELFARRHLPLAARIVNGRMQRVEDHLIPPSALREILVNALIHRDYSIAGGAISLAISDDRLEVWSAGTFPHGITPESLSRSHQSVQRNPIIADVFHRAGLIEKWGRGTNRVIEMCRAAGTALPEFSEVTGAAVVTFRITVGSTAHVAGHDDAQDTAQVTAQGTAQVTAHDAAKVAGHVSPQARRILRRLLRGERRREELQEAAGIAHREHFRLAHLEPLLASGLIERTIPDKPRSKLQRYRITAAGKRLVAPTRK